MSLTPQSSFFISDGTTDLQVLPEMNLASDSSDMVVLFINHSRQPSFISLEDTTGWTKIEKYPDSSHKITIFYKKTNTLPKPYTDYANTSTLLYVTTVVMSGIDDYIGMTESLESSNNISSLVTYPVYSAGANTITLFNAGTDNSDFLTIPNMQILNSHTENQTGFVYSVASGDVGGFTSDRVITDEYTAVALNFSRSTATPPSYTIPHYPVSIPDHINFQHIREILRASNKTFDGVAATYTITNNTVDSALIEGRVYYIGSGIANITAGYYYATASTTTPNFRSAGTDAVPLYYYESSDIIPSTGVATIQDIGVINGKEDNIGSTNLVYMSKNYTGYVRTFITAQDFSNCMMRVSLAKGHSIRVNKLFIVMFDGSGNWKLFASSTESSTSMKFVVIDANALTQVLYSHGTFDSSDIVSVGVYGTSPYNNDERYYKNKQNVSKIENITYFNPNFKEMLSFVYPPFFSETGTIGFTLQGNTTFSGVIDESVVGIGYPFSSWEYICDDGGVTLTFDNISGGINNAIINNDKLLNLVETSSTVTFDNTTIKCVNYIANTPKESTSFLECSKIIQNGFTITNCVIKDSLDDNVVLFEGLITGGTIEGKYCLEIATPGDYEINGTTLIAETNKFNVTAPTPVGVINVTTDISGITETDFNNPNGHIINILSPLSGYTLNIPNILDNSRYEIINITTDTVLTNDIVSGGTGVSENYIEESDFSPGDVGICRIIYADDSTAKIGFETEFVFPAGTNVNTVPTFQEDDEVFNQIGLDASLITEFVSDFPNVQIDITDTDNKTLVQRLYVWLIKEQTTSAGISNWFNAVYAEDIINYVYHIPIQLQNKKTETVVVSGGVIRRSDGLSIIADGTGNIELQMGRAYIAPEVTMVSEDLAFEGYVWIDVNDGVDSVNFPIGTRANPCKTLDNLISIGDIRKINSYQITGTLPITRNVDGKEFISYKNGKIIFNSAYSHNATRFRECKLSGTQHPTSMSLVYDCRIGNLQDIQGIYNNCRFIDTTPLILGSNKVELFSCKCQLDGEYVTFDFTKNGSFYSSDFTGNITVKNGSSVSIECMCSFLAGRFKLESSITGGLYVPTGIVGVFNESVSPAIVQESGVVSNTMSLDTLKENLIIEIEANSI